MTGWALAWFKPAAALLTSSLRPILTWISYRIIDQLNTNQIVLVVAAAAAAVAALSSATHNGSGRY